MNESRNGSEMKNLPAGRLDARDSELLRLKSLLKRAVASEPVPVELKERIRRLTKER